MAGVGPLTGGSTGTRPTDGKIKRTAIGRGACGWMYLGFLSALAYAYAGALGYFSGDFNASSASPTNVPAEAQ
jgi:hypothetical protein